MSVDPRILLPSAASTVSRTSPDFSPGGFEVISMLLFLDVTATPNNAETIQFVVEAKDPISGKYAVICATGAIAGTVFGATSTTSTFAFQIGWGPGSDAFAGTAGDVIGFPAVISDAVSYRVRVVQSAAGSWTYSVAGA